MKNKLLILFCYFALSTSVCLVAEELSIEKLDITLNSTKINGKGWDAFKNAPDIALCVVTMSDDHCYLRVGSKKDSSRKTHNPLFQDKKYSLCQNSYNCKFEINKLLNDISGIIILDLDTKNNDFVDAAIILNDAKEDSSLADKIKTMDERLRNISYKYSQVFTKREEKHRLKKFSVCKITKDSSNKCKLTQSKIEIN